MPDVGRAARLRVQRQLAVARHGVDMLERKQRIIAAEHERLLLGADHLQQAWERAARDAAVWADRAAALDGWPAIEAAAPSGAATMRAEAGHVMGVEFTDAGEATVPERLPSGGSSALELAAEAMAEAVRAAAAYAAARRASTTVEAELVATRTRRRAVEHRWIPRLEGELARIEGALEELEREENLRVRWALDARRPRRTAGSRTGGAG
ncbi:V-type ATP synthase subunit D [Demequina sp. SYSU T00039]|uniref:V-type ATP synthase subunit D n=1 Tax=Demequina lignilytica TaxID=3051663 RepID=A0AAW7M5F2_9MICO|nr:MULTISPECIES: V-type ATP synthase subunit D [unclassified Demequina]MDN4477517.1 V-type ATP synthase subunit D [Demequina sp. SYSU T00039-1]MDN4488132.1 V-type ATP synthase subunit D [Demequina sp. SYSU T00039]MDN4490573.1 V-type ATP synthase subunit D [Demequina sp. SYSU T00068]